ncbi:Uma2 family endonuclease [Chloracidobacterium thermophilum]|uniref:Uma2 family endonuclease n=1 Tax=Chloracidobacterium thermophilum TaxID=458033 RepID=UPI0007388CC2|nr:Uma2 family endonuclease [Chloracidobacterium thermophilum]
MTSQVASPQPEPAAPTPEPAVPAVVPELPPEFASIINLELPVEDGVPLESVWHRLQINLLDDCLHQHWRGRTDFFASGNMFVYYSLQQVKKMDYKGPDFFVVKDVDGSFIRGAWVAWEEGGRLPDVIIELLSPSTQAADLGSKKQLYERVFRTAEYFCYGPDPTFGKAPTLQGWELVCGRYEAIEPDARGWLWSNQLGAWLGEWEGQYHEMQNRWLRLYDSTGQLIPTRAEAAEAEAERAQAEAERARLEARQARDEAEAERARAEAAEARAAALTAEMERLRSGLKGTDQGPGPDEPA